MRFYTRGGSGSSSIPDPVTVPHGGTGLTSATTGDLLYASATDTLSKLAAGTLGNVVRQGASVAAWKSTIDPRTETTVFDDFCNYSSYKAVILAGTGSIADNNATSSAPDGTSIGVIESTVSAVGTLIYSTLASSSVNTFTFSGGATVIEWRVYIPALSNGTDRYILRIGAGDSTTTTAPVDGAWVEYSDSVNSGNWQGISSNNSTQTVLNSAVAVATGWNRITMSVNSAGTSVTWTVNGVSLGAAITTNIPIAYPRVFCPLWHCFQKTVGISAVVIVLDYAYFNKQVTR